MAFELHRHAYPGVCASAVNAGRAVAPAAGGDRQFVPVATNNVPIFGVAIATGATVGDAIAIADLGNTIKVPAGASLGRGQEIGVASTNGALGIVSGASGVGVQSAGVSVSAAAPGEQFSLYVRPRQLSGLV